MENLGKRGPMMPTELWFEPPGRTLRANTPRLASMPTISRDSCDSATSSNPPMQSSTTSACVAISLSRQQLLSGFHPSLWQETDDVFDDLAMRARGSRR